MQKIVLNEDCMGLWLTEKAINRLVKLGCQDTDSIKRDDPLLVQVVEELGEEASDYTLKIVEIPEDIKWYFMSFAGTEYIAEHHKTWR